MEMHSSDEVVVRFVESTLVLEQAALAAKEFVERKGERGPLADLILTVLDDAVYEVRVRRRHFRYGHDCTAARCDSDSHK